MNRSHTFVMVLALAIIALIGLLCLAIVSSPGPAQGWEMQGNGSVSYMLTGSDDTLYLFQGNNITAVRSDGQVAWNMEIPARWSASCSQTDWPGLPVVDEAGGVLYLCLFGQGPGVGQTAVQAGEMLNITAEVVAISSNGTISWEYPFTTNATSTYYWWNGTAYVYSYNLAEKTTIQVHNDRIFLLHDGSEDVLSDAGQHLFTIGNVTSPVAVDEEGRAYAARITSVEAYGPDGTSLWNIDLGENITGTYDNDASCPIVYRSLPLYANGTLYVPVDNGTAALGTDGRIRWVTHLTGGSYVPFSLLPVDDQGNVYMMIPDQPGGYTYVRRISSDGTAGSDAWKFNPSGVSNGGGTVVPAARDDGTIYYIAANPASIGPVGMTDDDYLAMVTNAVAAYDIRDGQALWSFQIPVEDAHELMLNASNINETLIQDNDYVRQMNERPGYYGDLPAGGMDLQPMLYDQITINPGRNVVYVSYFSAVFDSPAIYNRSRIVFVNSLYALGNNGSLLWKKPMDELVTGVVARNDTFYYSTNGGKIGGSTVGIAAGFALLAAALVFLRFLMMGTVARARARVDANGNRNALLRYVTENPGVTAVDIARELHMNLGTVRYHLFVLAANHRIAAQKDGEKYLRYFRNAGAYSREERSWLALMRREPVRRVLEALAARPGLSLQELSGELGMSSTAVHNHVSELTARGIVDRIRDDDRGYAYMIKDEYRPYLAKMPGKS